MHSISSHSHVPNIRGMFRVEVLVTGIKIESSNQRPFWGPIKGSRIAKINRSRTHGCNLTFDPLKIKCSRASEGNNQAIFGDQKLDPGCKHLNRQHASNTPWSYTVINSRS